MVCKKERTSKQEEVFDPADVFEKFTQVASEMCEEDTFEIDEENKEVLRLLTLYMCNHPDFEKEVQGTFLRSKPRLRAGVILIGNPGSGKSLVMKAFCKLRLPSNLMNLVYCDQVTDQYEKSGSDALVRFNKCFDGDFRRAPFYFDDLGYEKKSTGHYGTKTNCMMEVIIKQHRLYQDFKQKAHFSSNYSLSELSSLYDIRTESRLSEMCNVIVLGHKADSKDRRKKYQ